MPINPGLTFASLRPLDPLSNYRAYAEVIVTGPGGARSPKLQCLVDTGSDYTILPGGAATAAGIVVAGPPVTIRTAGGHLFALPSQINVRLIVEGFAFFAPIVVFSAAIGFTPILGRLELVQPFDVGFDTTNWYWD